MKSDSGFEFIVDGAVNSAVHRGNPGEVYVVEMDGWFDYKWQKFSGTVMHEVAIWSDTLTVPPFHPSRVLSEKYFRLIPELGLYERAPAKPLHIHQASAQNLQRAIRDISSSGIFVWYSRINKDSDRASLMLYAIDSDNASGWYAGFAKEEKWRLSQVKGASRRAVKALVLASNQTPKLLDMR